MSIADMVEYIYDVYSNLNLDLNHDCKCEFPEEYNQIIKKVKKIYELKIK